MAKLTRTQKYAEFRENLSHDSESSLSTKELSDYEDRLNNMTNYAEANENVTHENVSVASDVNNANIAETTPIEQLVDSFKEQEKLDQQQVRRDQTIEQSLEELQNILKQDYQSMHNQDVQEVKQEPVEENTPYSNIEISPIGSTHTYEQQVPVQNENVAELEEEPQYMGLYVNPKIEQAYKENELKIEEERKLQEEAATQSSYEAQIKTGIVDGNTLNDVVINNETVEQQEPIEEEIVRPTIMSEPADNHAINYTGTAQNTYINEVMSEVDEHLKQNGQQNINDLTEDMVNEVRRNENKTVLKPKEVEYSEPTNNNDESYSNTVSMEISKIMDEVVETDSQKVVSPAAQVKQEVKAQREEKTNVQVEPHPVLTQSLPQEKKEEVVEIKNIDDIDVNDVPVKEATTGTIPFVVSANDEEFIDDDNEEDSSNTILNIILIILIVILVAVLGLIIFYILKTRGVI